MRKFLIVMAVLVISFSAVAKRDFAVYSELRCENNKCFDLESDEPFTGEVRSYYNNGVVKSSVEYKDGLKDGATHYFYGNGNEKRQEVYTNGVIHGMITEYYDNGNLKFEVEFGNGMRNGAFRSYYEDGQLKVEEEYINGKKEGRARKYSNRGKLAREAFFENGKLLGGVCISFDGKKSNITQEMINAYNKIGVVPCDK